MSKKNVIIMLTVIAVLLAGLLTMQFLTRRRADEIELQNNLGFKPPEEVIYYSETHGGFNGDGETVIIFVPGAEDVSQIDYCWDRNISVADIREFLYGKDIDRNFLEDYGFPMPKEGFRYLVWDNRSSDMSWNFIYAMYDPENNICYYIRFDT